MLPDWYWGVLPRTECFGTLKYSKMLVPFLNIGVWLFYFKWLFNVFLIFVKDLSYSSVAGTNFMASVWYWFVSLLVGCFGTLRFSKMRVQFLVIFSKLFWFFDRLLRAIMVTCDWCCLECFLRTRYHLLSRVTIRVTTHVTILLREFCIIFNGPLLWAHYYIGYCIPY